MKKIKVNLFDSLAPPHYYEEWGYHNFSSQFEPTKIEWIREGQGLGMPEFDGVTVFTDKDITSSWVDKVETKHKIAWLVECRTIHPMEYKQLLLVEDKFDYIFTFDEELLKRGPKYVKNLVGTSRVSNKDAGIHKKTKLLSWLGRNDR